MSCHNQGPDCSKEAKKNYKQDCTIKARFVHFLLFCSKVQVEINWDEVNVSNLKCEGFLTFSKLNVSICSKLILVCPVLSRGALCNRVSQILAIRTAVSFRPWSVHTEMCFSAFRPSNILSNGAKCCSTCVKTLPFTFRSILPLWPKKYNSPIVKLYPRSKGCHLTAV